MLDERVKRKREIFEYYHAALSDLPGIEFMPEPEWSRSNRWLTVILITPEEFGADRETVRLALDEEKIEARPVWKPMHMQPVFDIEQRTEEELATKLRSASYARQADTHRQTQTFPLRTSQGENSRRFAGKAQNKKAPIKILSDIEA